MESTSVGQRFTQLIHHLGISKNAFAVSLDKTATVIQHLVEERNKPGFDLICKVFEVYPNVSKDWLLQGSGPMLTTAGETPKQATPAEKPARTAAEIPAAPVVPAEVSSVEAPAMPVAVPASVPAPAPVVFAAAESPAPKPTTPEPTTHAAEPAAPTAPEPAVPLPAAVPVVAVPAVAAAPAAPDAGAWQTALYTQQMAHQLAMAEMRNQHLQDQQRLMQQMMDLMQRKMA